MRLVDDGASKSQWVRRWPGTTHGIYQTCYIIRYTLLCRIYASSLLEAVGSGLYSPNGNSLSPSGVLFVENLCRSMGCASIAPSKTRSTLAMP